MRATVIGAAVLMMHTVVMPASADSSARSNLTNFLEADLSRRPARTGLYVKHLGTGEQASVRAQRTEVDDRIGALARRVVDYFDGGRKETH